MAFEKRPNSGQLFKNDKKGDNSRAPNLKGSALLQLENGELLELDLAAWTRESEKAGRWLSLSIKLKGDRQSTQSRSDGGRQQFNNHVNQHGTALDGQGVPPDDKDIPFLVNIDVSPERHLPRA
jgi:hypothetical protein